MRLPENLTLLYEPVIDLKTRRAVALQAVVRWSSRFEHDAKDASKSEPHQHFALHKPEVDLPLLQVVCSHLGDWAGAGNVVRVCIPVHGQTLGYPNLVNHLGSAAQRFGVSLDQLELGLTPVSEIDDWPQALNNVDELRRSGAKLTLLGFGIGFQSLARMVALPCDQVEVTESWVRQLDQAQGSMSIVSATCDMFRSRGVCAAAAGVDTDEQVRLIAQAGCQLGRGLAFSEPVIPLIVPATLAAHH